MTLFEYLAIAFSLVFSSAAMRLVGGLPHAFDARKRYWVHLTFVGLQLLVTLTGFWAFWSFRDISWNLGSFTLALIGPSLLYFNACTLIPENPESVASWRDHYYAVRRRYFSGVVAWVLVVAAASTLLIAMAWLHRARIGQAFALGAGLVGGASSSHRIHAILALSLACSACWPWSSCPGPVRWRPDAAMVTP